MRSGHATSVPVERNAQKDGAEYRFWASSVAIDLHVKSGHILNRRFSLETRTTSTRAQRRAHAEVSHFFLVEVRNVAVMSEEFVVNIYGVTLKEVIFIHKAKALFLLAYTTIMQGSRA